VGGVERGVGNDVCTRGRARGDVLVIDGGVVAFLIWVDVCAGVAGAWDRLFVLTPTYARCLQLMEDVVRGAGRASQSTGHRQIIGQASGAGLVVGVQRPARDHRLDIGRVRVADDGAVGLVFHHDDDDRLRRAVSAA